jgi:hypothetical protein
MSIDESPDDIDVWTLARRLVDGLPVSAAGVREVAAELLRWADVIRLMGHLREENFHIRTGLDRAARRLFDKLYCAIDAAHTARAKESR